MGWPGPFKIVDIDAHNVNVLAAVVTRKQTHPARRRLDDKNRTITEPAISKSMA
jgi:hypothetical protein